ncbi:MAG: hypothetical protein PHY83_03140 [Bacilli bacterium]|nr:hypothetical protein [Bacilli bacterium]
MEHSQLVIRYRPKYQNLNTWYSDYSELQQFISFDANTNASNSTDGSQITFSRKTLFDGVGTYNSGTQTITCSTANWKTNEWRWFTILDAKNNRYKIASNTTNTITLIPASEFNYPGVVDVSSFKITLPLFEIGDLIDIYVWKITDGDFPETLDEDNLVFVGQIKGINDRFGNGGVQTIITLEDITEVLFKSFNNPKISAVGSFQTFISKIKDYIIAWVNEGNKNMINLIWDPTNPTHKRDTITEFPAIDYYTDYKPNYEIISDLCQPKYTEDGEYYFYIKPSLNSVSSQPEYLFVLRPKQQVVTSNLIEGKDFKLINRTKDKGDIVTFLVIRCGRDVYNNNVTTFVWGDQRYGTLGKPVAVNFAGDIMDWEIIKDKEAGNSNFDDVDPVKLPLPLKNSTGNYTTYYSVTSAEASIFPTKLSEGQFVATTASKYNNWVRWLAKAKARISGQQYLLQNNFVKNKVVVEFYNVPISAIPGDLYQLKIDSIGWTDSSLGGFNYTKKLRNLNRQINVSNKGVSTKITYEEDWELGAQ